MDVSSQHLSTSPQPSSRRFNVKQLKRITLFRQYQWAGLKEHHNTDKNHRHMLLLIYRENYFIPDIPRLPPVWQWRYHNYKLY